MTPIRPTRLTLLAIGATAILTSTLTSVAPDVKNYVLGSTAVTNVQYFPSTGSGVILRSGDMDVRWRKGTFTATGGLAKYDSFLAANPFNGTGVLLRLALLIDDNANSFTWDCSFTSSADSATGGTVLINNGGSGSGGSAFYPGSGDANGIVWNTGDNIKCGTLSSTTSFSGSIIYQAIDFPGR